MEDLIKCSKCCEFKPKSSFTQRLNRKSGYRSSCRVCSNIASNNYKKSKEGLIRRILVQQKRSSKKRGHVPPKYSLDEFRSWFYLQPNFEDLYLNWVSSNFDKNITPSVDRLNDLNPYCFENIRLVTWRENMVKAFNDKLNGVTNKDMKKVYQYDINMNFIRDYHSGTYASKIIGCSQTAISKGCLNYPKVVLNFLWSYKKHH